MKTFCRLVSVVAVAFCGRSSAGAPAASPIEKIRAYQGTWKMELEHLASPYGKASKETSTLKNDCWTSSGFFACNQIVDGESKALLVFTYDPKKDLYTSHGIPSDGGAAFSGTLIIKDNVWTFPWEVTEKGKTVYFHVINTFVGSTIEFRQEYSADNQHWTLMGKGIEHKIAP